MDVTVTNDLALRLMPIAIALAAYVATVRARYRDRIKELKGKVKSPAVGSTPDSDRREWADRIDALERHVWWITIPDFLLILAGLCFTACVIRTSLSVLSLPCITYGNVEVVGLGSPGAGVALLAALHVAQWCR